MQMLCFRNQRQKHEQCDRVNPPVDPARFAPFAEVSPAGQIGPHQNQNQSRDDARFLRQVSQPTRPHKKTPDRKPSYAGDDEHSKKRRKAEIEPAESALWMDKIDSESGSEMIDCDECESEEAPE